MVTVDTNIAVYAYTYSEKTEVADAILQRADLASCQVAIECANVLFRKFKRSWQDVDRDIQLLRSVIPSWHPIELENTGTALWLAHRYRLQFYDALMIAVGLAHGATTLFSEDMQHGLLIEGTLRIENPFL